MNIHILVTCRNPELFRASTLVFDTIRVGFPDAVFHLYWNFDLSRREENTGENARWLRETSDKLSENKVIFRDTQTVHHDWIQKLINEENEPFFICDTDMIFFDRFPIENCAGDVMSGRYIPRFEDEVTKCVTHARLHTSLMYFNPVKVRAAMETYYAQFPKLPFGNMRPNLIVGSINPVMEGGDQVNYFHDTCSMLYNAIGGNHFSETELETYYHLNCGTYSDIVSKTSKSLRFLRMHNERFMKNPELARGMWREQEKFYARNAR